MKRSAKIIQIVAGIGIAAAGLGIFFRDVDIRGLGRELGGHHPLAIIGCMALIEFSLWIRSLRWNYLLPRMPGAARTGLFGIVNIGFMVNNILPARMGEAARVVFIWKRNGFPLVVGLGSVMLERILDMVFFALCFSVPVLLTRDPAVIPAHLSIFPGRINLTIGHCAGIVTAGCLFLIALFGAYGLVPGRFNAALRAMNGLLPARVRGRVHTIGSELGASLSWLSRPPEVLAVGLLSVLTVLPFAGMLFLLIGNWSPGGFLQGMFTQGFASFGALIPLSPGYVGTLHAVLLEGLRLIGVPLETGRAIAILYHATGYIPVTVTGLCFFFAYNISMKEISQARETLSEKE